MAMQSERATAAPAATAGSAAGSGAQRKRSIPRPSVASLKHAGMFSLSIILFIAIWDLVIRIFHVEEYLAPAPLQVAKVIVREWGPQLQDATMVTMLETVVGFGAAVGIGVPLAVLLTYSKIASRLLYPMMVSSQVVPKVAIAPLFVIWFGFGMLPKVLVAFLTAFFVIVVNTTMGLKSVEPNMLHLARSMGASTLQIFVKVRLPNALPSLFAALKVAITLAVVGAVVGEFVGSDRGLGYILLVSTGSLATDLVFGCITLMAFVGLALYVVVEVAERLAIPWQRSVRVEQMEGSL